MTLWQFYKAVIDRYPHLVTDTGRDSGVAQRILVLAPFPPQRHALHAGARIAAELLIRVSQTHPTALLYMRSAGEAACDAALQDQCEFVREIPRPATGKSIFSRLRWFVRQAKSMRRGEPRRVGDWRVEQFQRTLSAAIKEFRPDIIHAESHLIGQYLLKIDPSLLCILVEHDLGVVDARYRYGVSKGWRKRVYRRDLGAWERYSKRLLERVDGVVAFTQRDGDEIHSVAPTATVTCIPLSCSVPNKPLDRPDTNQPSVLFFGNFRHYPNVDAAFWLIHNIFPKVHACCPEVEFIIAGDAPTNRMRAMARGKNIRIAGPIAHLDPWLERASVVVAPLRLGGGMRLKVLETIAHGKPLIATSRALEGLTVENGRHVLVADTDEEFARSIVRLIHNRSERDALAVNGWAWARRNLSWDKVANAFDELYDSMCANTAKRRL